MTILTYDGVKDKESTFRAMTSLDRDEFEDLCTVFREAWNEKAENEGRDPSKGGRKPKLESIEDRLFFILFYLKTYPLQEVLGHQPFKGAPHGAPRAAINLAVETCGRFGSYLGLERGFLGPR